LFLKLLVQVDTLARPIEISEVRKAMRQLMSWVTFGGKLFYPTFTMATMKHLTKISQARYS